MSAPKIYVAGHRGMVGSAIVRQLLAQGHSTDHIISRMHSELDLTNQAAVRVLFVAEKPDQVFLVATKVGGIHANNTYPAEFVYQNLLMQANVIDAAISQRCAKATAKATVSGFHLHLPQAGPSAHAGRCSAHWHA